MQTTETLSPLAEFGQRIYERAREARREETVLRAEGKHHSANLLRAQIAVLVELHNDLDRTRDEAEKASVEKPSPVVGSSAWVGEHGQEPSGERTETGGPLVGRGVLKAIYEDDIAEMKERVQDALQTRLCRRTLAAVEWELKRMMDENESLAVAVAAEDNGESKSGACSPTDEAHRLPETARAPHGEGSDV